MLKITLTHNETYAENPQANSIRWRIMYKKDDGSFVDQAAVMKCKDFFNDVVAKVTGGKEFIKYSFNNEDIKSNEEGIYILLTGVNSPKTIFARNITKILNPRLKEELGCGMDLEVEPARVMLLIPSKVWTSTYYISLLSLLIRGCNYNILIKDWDHLFTVLYEKEGYGSSYATGCEYLRKEHCQQLSEVGFNIPLAEKYWFYSMSFNSESYEDYALASTVHDNGVVSWIRAGAVKSLDFA